jgi:hypothetical protein
MSIEEIVEQARTAPRESLPELIGQLARAQAEAHIRLSAPAPAPAKAQVVDEWLTAKETAAILHVTESFLYHGGRETLQARKVGRSLRFSRRAIQNYLDQQTNGGR